MNDIVEFPFEIDTVGVECQVHLEPDLMLDGQPYEGAVKYAYDGEIYIALRTYDERVLLHEIIHVICRKNRKQIEEWLSSDGSNNQEEGLVRVLTRGLFAMGWRWKGIARNDAIAERDMQAAYDAADEANARVVALTAELDRAHRTSSG